MPVPALPITRNLKRKSEQIEPKSGKPIWKERYREKYGIQEANTVTRRETHKGRNRAMGNNSNS